MSLLGRKITAFLKKVADLPDRPSPIYSAADIKAQFDSSPEELRIALNGIIDDLASTAAGASGADQIGSASITGVAGTTLYAQLSAIKALVDGAANQNAFSTVAVAGQSSLTAEAVSDTLTIVGGTGIGLTTNAGTDTLTITALGDAVPGAHASSHITNGTDVIPNAVAGGNAGLMSGADKTKLDGAQLFPLTATDGTGKGGTYTSNMNTLIVPGFYSVAGTAANTPTSNNGVCIVLKGPGTVHQMFTVTGTSQLLTQTFTRSSSDSGATWINWNQLLMNNGPQTLNGALTLGGALAMGGNSLSGVNKIDFVNGSRISENAGQRVAINAEADRFDVVTEDGVNFILKADYTNDIFQFKGVDVLLASGTRAMTAFLSFIGNMGVYAKNGNNTTLFDFDFPDVTTAAAGLRLFRSTVTTGIKSFTLHDGTATQSFKIENGTITALSGSPIIIKAGTNSPEGVLTAPVGSVYLCTNGAVSTTLYVKTSGTGNTGWTAK